MPLGKIIKTIKYQRTKGKKVKKDKSVPAETKTDENDVDVLNVVRQINLDNLGITTNFDSNSGHENSSSKKANMIPEFETIKKRKVGEGIPVSVPRRRRSSFTPGKFQSRSTSKAHGITREDASRGKSLLDVEIKPDKGSKTRQRKIVKGKKSSLEPKAKASDSYHIEESDKSEEHDIKVVS